MALGLREGTTEWTLGGVSAPPPMEKRAAGVRTSKGLKKAAFPSVCFHLSECRSGHNLGESRKSLSNSSEPGHPE